MISGLVHASETLKRVKLKMVLFQSCTMELKTMKSTSQDPSCSVVAVVGIKSSCSDVFC